MTFFSLFAGIGGFDLGLDRAGMTCIGQCEINPFCNKILEKHWPKVFRHQDIKTLTGNIINEKCGKPDVLCGGFPCQDISQAGNRLGLKGKRSGLWSEYYRLIRELRPKFVVVENVSALLVPIVGGIPAPISRVLGDLSEIGYDAEWDCISASMFGASHQRKRIFILAYSNLYRKERLWKNINACEIKTLQSNKIFMPNCNSTWEDIKFGPIGNDTALILRNDDGFPDWMDQVGSLGNAVIPQIAEYIGKAIISKYC